MIAAPPIIRRSPCGERGLKFMIASWCVNWYHSGSPDVNALIDIFKNYTATQVVAAATFVSVFCVDVDGDGRPDAAQKQAEKNQPTPPPAIPIRLENKK